MTPRLLLAGVLLGTLACGAAAATDMTVALRSGGEQSFEVTDHSILHFGNGVLSISSDEQNTSPGIRLADIESIKFRSGAQGMNDLTDSASSALRLRRNPVNDFLEFEGTASYPARVEIFSLQGSRLISIPAWSGNPIDVTSLPQGIYLLTVDNSTFKFIKS